MANTDPYAKHKLRKTEENRANPSKFYTHFFCKALIASIFLVIFPLFASQAPEFINQTFFTRSWELLHIVFVGIAISYGLFSHRNDKIEKEINNHTNFDNARSYVSRFLQVSSVFDDENENLTGSEDNKIQTWSNQYYRNEPVVVVAKGPSVLDQEQRVTSSRIGEKPLLLPVRSLKSRVLDSEIVEPIKESKSLRGSSSNSVSRRYSSNSNKVENAELGGFVQVNLVEKLNENVVLPSPIPWRSRSGRMEMKEDVDCHVCPLYPVSPSMEETELNRPESRFLRPKMPRSNRPSSTSSSPQLSPSSPSPKSFYRPPAPPPPPSPSPPPIKNKSSSLNVISSLNNDRASSQKNLKRSFTAEAKESSDEEIDQRTSKTDQLSWENEAFVDKFVVEIDEDSETEDDDDVMGETPLFERSSNNEEAASISKSSVSDGGPDVDKKADEFIAKFREQIRLQRIKSIKRSSSQIKENSSR